MSGGVGGGGRPSPIPIWNSARNRPARQPNTNGWPAGVKIDMVHIVDLLYKMEYPARLLCLNQRAACIFCPRKAIGTGGITQPNIRLILGVRCRDRVVESSVKQLKTFLRCQNIGSRYAKPIPIALIARRQNGIRAIIKRICRREIIIKRPGVATPRPKQQRTCVRTSIGLVYHKLFNR